MPRKLGQHFLKNPAVARAMAQALDLKPGDVVVEIGPGQGQLTQALVTAGAGIKIIAIEKDPALAEEARQRFKDNPAIQIASGDALKELQATSYKLQAISYKVTGNIPYYITGRLLRIIGELDPRPELAVLMVQKEVAERIVAGPPRMNRLAASVQFWAEPRIVRNVGRKEFNPAPEVDSAVILLQARETAPPATSEDAAAFYRAVRTLFAQPRKTVLNNLKSGLGDEKAVEILERWGVDLRARPQVLSIAEIANISKEVEF
jgi:16S rRNA (adenine1518-N6/adenine1519-N6)-dimethyltransferase